MNVLIANFGNESLAMIQWALETQLDPFCVFSVDTGWSSESWRKHLINVFQYLEQNDVSHQHLSAQKTFAECVMDRGSFPSKKFQWCAPFLKGLVINDALDEIDLEGSAKIFLPKIKQLSRSNENLESGLTNEHYQDRVVEYPLLNGSIKYRNELIARAGFSVLSHKSQECSPCVYTTKKEIQHLPQNDLSRLNMLEKELDQRMFLESEETNSSMQYDMGCGNVWGCGE